MQPICYNMLQVGGANGRGGGGGGGVPCNEYHCVANVQKIEYTQFDFQYACFKIRVVGVYGNELHETNLKQVCCKMGLMGTLFSHSFCTAYFCGWRENMGQFFCHLFPRHQSLVYTL